MKKILYFFKNDIVLTAALILAVVSCFIIPPNAGYMDYIDFNTLIMLFCLMLIVEGMRGEDFFRYIGNRILRRVGTGRGVMVTLVFLCFFGSMFITNDVSLITFVPFGLMILEMTGLTSGVCFGVVLMTIAANLGSMFTPVGNPQNLYLFSLSGMSIAEFFRLMLPYTAVSAVLLVICIFAGYRNEKLDITEQTVKIKNKKRLCLYILLFVLCLLTVSGIVPHWTLLVIVSVSLLIFRRMLFLRVDYALLLTFVFFFIFTGNMNHVEGLRSAIARLLSGRETLVSILCSQVISNVPAAMLLSGYTDNIPGLIVGTNLGGLGTLIASMASLISYKQMALNYPQSKKKYIGIFTIFNVIFLAVLCIVWMFMM